MYLNYSLFCCRLLFLVMRKINYNYLNFQKCVQKLFLINYLIIVITIFYCIFAIDCVIAKIGGARHRVPFAKNIE